MKSRKATLSDENRAFLNTIHKEQITLEIALVVFVVSLLTVNVASVVPGYAVVAVIGVVLSSLVLLVFGVLLTAGVSSMRYKENALSLRSRAARRWLLAVWWTIPLIVVLLVLSAAMQNSVFTIGVLVLVALLVLFMLAAVITALVLTHLLWRRFNKKKRSPIRPIAYGIIALNIFILGTLGSYTTTELVAYKSTTVTDAALELGQSEVRQAGKDGNIETKRNLLFGFALSTETEDPVDEIIANGSRRYQYMYCSNGSYRYFSAEQFKDPNVGFTHQSPDYCAQNGEGTQTTIADTPPAEKIIQQVPTYYPAYRAPSSYTTTCSSYSFNNSITCRTY